jgi:hypothetical protein
MSAEILFHSISRLGCRVQPRQAQRRSAAKGYEASCRDLRCGVSCWSQRPPSTTSVKPKQKQNSPYRRQKRNINAARSLLPTCRADRWFMAGDGGSGLMLLSEIESRLVREVQTWPLLKTVSISQ